MKSGTLIPGRSRAPDGAEAPAEPSAGTPVQARRLARNSLLTLGTRGLTLVLGLVFVPLMIRSVGMELYGLLGVTWMVLGQLGWMDLGFSAACTRFVSRSLALGRPEEAAGWAWTSIVAQAVVGGVAAAALWFGAPSIAEVLRVTPERIPLVVLTLRLFALVIPVEMITRSLTALLEATQRFGWVNALTLFSSLWTNTVYLLAILRGGDFLLIIHGLVALRVAALVGAYLAAGRALPGFGVRAIPRGSVLLRHAREMLGFGGWVTVNSAVGPLLLYFDRWLMGILLGVAALPLFTVPFNLVMQLTLIPASVAATLFPAFSALRAGEGWERAEEFYVRSHRYLAVALVPALFGLFVWAPEVLRLWVGPEIAAQSTATLRLLVAGLAFALLAPVSGALLNGAGRPDLVARIYLLELPFNAVLMWVLVRGWGIEGAAVGFMVRAFAETAGLWFVVHRVFRWRWRDGLGPHLARAAGAAAVLSALAVPLWNPHVRSPLAVGATLVALAAYAAFASRFLLDERDHAFLRGALRPGRA